MKKAISTEFFRYTLISGLAFLVDITTLAVSHEMFHIHYLASTILGFIAGTIVTYNLSVFYVFNIHSHQQTIKKFLAFLMVGVSSLLISLVVMFILVEILSAPVLLAKCLTTSLTLITNFIGRRIILLRHPSSTIPNLVSTSQ